MEILLFYGVMDVRGCVLACAVTLVPDELCELQGLHGRRSLLFRWWFIPGLVLLFDD